MRPLVFLSLLAFFWQTAGAVTYDVRAVHICENATYCTDDDKVLRRFEQVNKRWKPVGISFRPTVTRLYDATYAAISDSNSPGYADLLDMAKDTPQQITFYVIEGGNFVCWANLPQKEDPDSRRAYALFCYTAIHGTAWAHELGHYFCLPHPFTFQDPATNNPLIHDGDALADTLPDPGIKEGDLINTGGPDQGANRHWCDTSKLLNSYSDIDFEYTSEPGLPKKTGCTVACVSNTTSGTQPIAYTPLTENGMSYYHGCQGPWTVEGVRHEYFVPDQAARIAQCIVEEPERAMLPDVCAGDGDDDGDGLCNQQDACPERPALVGMDTDSDNDGIVDGCDACPDFPGMGTDTDADGFCDAIDEDDDNDLCKDADDEHPLEDMVAVGWKLGDRPQCSGPIHLWEGTATASGVRICHKTFDHDIDGDGIVNDRDRCLLEPGLGCIQNVSCPLPPPNWWLACTLGGCNELEFVVTAVSNPEFVLARSTFQIANGTLYSRAAQGQTLLETARTFAGFDPPGFEMAAGVGAKSTRGESSRRLRFEIRRRDGSLVERFAEADADRVRLGELVRGAVLVLTTDNEGSRVTVDVSWGVGIAPGTAVADADRDQVFDALDNCTAVANMDQYDADGDGYGNRCDPDLDNDGRVTSADATRMGAAIGGVGNIPYAGEDRQGHDVFDLPPTLVEFVPEADLDGDGDVTRADQALWSSARLGPSGVRR